LSSNSISWGAGGPFLDDLPDLPDLAVFAPPSDASPSSYLIKGILILTAALIGSDYGKSFPFSSSSSSPPAPTYSPIAAVSGTLRLTNASHPSSFLAFQSGVAGFLQ